MKAGFQEFPDGPAGCTWVDGKGVRCMEPPVGGSPRMSHCAKHHAVALVPARQERVLELRSAGLEVPEELLKK